MPVTVTLCTSETGAYGFYYRTEQTIEVPADLELEVLLNTHGVYVENDGYEPVILTQDIVNKYQLPNSLGWRKK